MGDDGPFRRNAGLGFGAEWGGAEGSFREESMAERRTGCLRGDPTQPRGTRILGYERGYFWKIFAGEGYHVSLLLM